MLFEDLASILGPSTSQCQAIRETNGDSLRDPVLVRCLGLSEEELQDGGPEELRISKTFKNPK